MSSADPSGLSFKIYRQGRDAEYALLAGITVVIWSIVENAVDDYRLITETKVGVPGSTYLLSRASTLLFFVTSLIYQEDDCQAISRVGFAFLVIHLSTTLGLLFLRVQAIYPRNHYVKLFFSALGLSCVVTLIVSYVLQAKQPLPNSLEPTFPNCTLPPSDNTILPKLVLVPSILLTAFNIFIFATFVFMLIDAGLLWDKEGKSIEIMGIHIPLAIQRAGQLSTRILNDCMIYFFYAMMVKIPQIVVLTQGGTALEYKLIIFLDVALTCIVTNKLYRNFRLGLPGLLPGTVSMAASPDGPQSTVPMSTLKFGWGVEPKNQNQSSDYTASTV